LELGTDAQLIKGQSTCTAPHQLHGAGCGVAILPTIKAARATGISQKHGQQELKFLKRLD